MIKSVSQKRIYRDYSLLALAVLVVSTAAVLTKGAQNEGATSGAIAFLRLGLASACLALVSLNSIYRGLEQSTTDTILKSALAGIFLAAHFLTWIISLEYIPVSRSTFLVTTSPLWVAIISFLFLKEIITRQQVIGIMISIGSALFIFYNENEFLGRAAESFLKGEMLATFGAISIAAYLIIGRTLRNTIDLKTYVFLTYGFATMVLALLRLCSEEQLIPSLSPTAWLYISLLALGPQLIGHTILNWGVRRFSATIVSMTVLAEPIAASILAWIILDEIVGPSGFIGFTGILLGIGIVIYDQPIFAFLTNKLRNNQKSI